MILTL
jgi:importin subunit beta-1